MRTHGIPRARHSCLKRNPRKQGDFGPANLAYSQNHQKTGVARRVDVCLSTSDLGVMAGIE